MDAARLLKAFGSSAYVSGKVTSEVDVCGLIRKGLPYKAVEILYEQDKITPPEMYLFIPPRTLARRKKERRFNADESDTIARLVLILDFAEEVFGDHEKAKTWLRRPNQALNDLRPIELLETDYGARIVEKVLGRIAHGVYS